MITVAHLFIYFILDTLYVCMCVCILGTNVYQKWAKWHKKVKKVTFMYKVGQIVSYTLKNEGASWCH